MTEVGKSQKLTGHKKLTGRRVALYFCGAFAVIIAANLTLAYSAVGTFPGLETRKPYNESLSFESRRMAQERLGWSSVVKYNAGEVVLTLKDRDGGTVVIPNISLVVGHATSDKFDQVLELQFDGHNYVAQVDLPAGNWQAKIKATALDGTAFSRTLSLYIRTAS